MIVYFALVILGFILLIKGADYLVSGSASIAKKSGIPSIVIGLTIVAFGTSMPEMLINFFSAVQGNTDLAVSNILGSNIANIFLILGVAAVITPLNVQRNTTSKEVPFAFLAVLVIGLLANDVFFDNETTNIISRSEGLVMLLFFSIFLYYTYLISRGNVSEMENVKTYRTYISTLMVLGGIISLFVGGKFTVDGAIGMATTFGVSERVIGLTIIAIGTSLPELVTAIVGATKRQTDIVVGNVIGSNIFNIFWILGFTATITPLPFSESLNYDVIINIFAGIILFISLLLGTQHKIAKWEGVIFLTIYLFYLGSLLYIQ